MCFSRLDSSPVTKGSNENKLMPFSRTIILQVLAPPLLHTRLSITLTQPATQVKTLSVNWFTWSPFSAISASHKKSSGIQTRWPLIWSNFSRTSLAGVMRSNMWPGLTPLGGRKVL